MNSTKKAIFFLTFAVSLNADTLFMTNSQNQLLRGDTNTPGSIMTVGSVSGLSAGENLVGIDFRPANGQLLGLGSSSRLYAIDINTAAAVSVGSPGAFSLNGTSFGFDFNPTVDRIRVTSNAGQDLRLNPNDGTLSATDGALNGATTSIVASAYTNSFGGATTTTLYGIDNTTGSLYVQNPPNAGTQMLVGSLGVGGTIGSNVGFDIGYPGNIAYATLQTGSAGSGLYSVNLGTGAASLVANINGQSVTGLATSAVPEPSTMWLLGAGLTAFGGIRLRRARLSRKQL